MISNNVVFKEVINESSASFELTKECNYGHEYVARITAYGVNDLKSNYVTEPKIIGNDKFKVIQYSDF